LSVVSDRTIQSIDILRTILLTPLERKESHRPITIYLE
jgi:hypothetical protein